MFEDLYPIMGVLLYLGKGDNRLVIGERNAMISAYKTLCPDSRLTDQLINCSINEMNVPSKTKFKHLVIELASMDIQIQRLVLNAAGEMFASRKKLNLVEQEGMAELSKRLCR